jgi:Mg-chelatase subunit ChlD
MNPESSRDATEARLTAFLLGELPAEELAALRREIEVDPEMARRHDQLAQTIELVREATRPVAEEQIRAATPLRLSAERRERLLQSFKTIQPRQFATVERHELPWFIPMGVAAALVALIGLAALLPDFGQRSRKASLAMAAAVSRRADEPRDVFMKKNALATPGLAPGKPSQSGPTTVIVAELPTPKQAIDPIVLQETDGLVTALSGPQTSPAMRAKQGEMPLSGRLVAGDSIPLPREDLDAAVKDSKASTPPVADKVPILGDVPALGRFFRQEAAPKQVAQSVGQRNGINAGPPTSSFGFELRDQIAQPVNPESDSASNKRAQSLAGMKGPLALSGASTRADYDNDGLSALFLPEPNAQGAAKDLSVGEPVPTGTAAPGSDIRFNANSAALVQTLEPETVRGLERERLAAENRAARYRIALPQLADADSRKASAALRRGLELQVEAQQATATNLSLRLSELKQKERSTEKGSKRGLLAEADPEQRTLLAVAPPSSRVEEAARAPVPNPAPFWDRVRQLMGGKVERTARVELPPEQTDTARLLYGSTGPNTFDPYFIQTEPEKIKSKTVLYRVIEKLKLNESWASKHGAVQGNPSISETYQLLVPNVEVRPSQDGRSAEIRVKSVTGGEAALIANTIAEVYGEVRQEQQQQVAGQLAEWHQQQDQLNRETPETTAPIVGKEAKEDAPPPKLAPTAPIPQPEVQTVSNAFSTFSLNVADVSFKLAAASLEKGVMPEPATVRSEEFINAFDYRDPAPPTGVPIGFAWERSQYPFAQDRDLLRFSMQTAAQGRSPGYPLNLVVLLDKSGSMERADRVAIVGEALHVLAGQLQPQDKLSIVTFARTARLWADGVDGNQAGPAIQQVTEQTPEGGTNLEDALKLAYETALKHYIHGGGNRVVLLTDGAANLGNVDPGALQHRVEALRRQGVALDCFGVGWEGFNDDLLEVLSSHGDGRYGFLNTPEDAATGFAGQLAGALRVAAADVKVQVEFNPRRVTAFRQIGYANHQLTKEQFRDNTVDAAEMGAAESGNALYVVRVNPRGDGDLGVVRVRFKVPSTGEFREQEWTVPYTGDAVSLEQASVAQRLAAVAGSFPEWLVSSPYSGEITPNRLLAILRGVPEAYGADSRPTKLEWMIRQAKSVTGK